MTKPPGKSHVDPAKCVGCGRCVGELGCPALIRAADGRKAMIDETLCTGCTLCEQVCPVKAISGGDRNATEVRHA